VQASWSVLTASDIPYELMACAPTALKTTMTSSNDKLKSEKKNKFLAELNEEGVIKTDNNIKPNLVTVPCRMHLYNSKVNAPDYKCHLMQAH